MMVAWVAMGLAVLSKGLAGVVLPALALLSYTALQRNFSGWRNLRLTTGVRTTDADVDRLLEVLPGIVERVREVTPSLVS